MKTILDEPSRYRLRLSPRRCLPRDRQVVPGTELKKTDLSFTGPGSGLDLGDEILHDPIDRSPGGRVGLLEDVRPPLVP